MLHTRVAFTALTLALATTLSAQDWAKSHSTTDLESFLMQEFSAQGRVDVRKAVHAAESRGWLKTVSDRILIKRQFRNLARKRGGNSRLIDLRPRPVAVSLPSLGNALSEKEYNDSACYGQDLGVITSSGQTISGSLATNDADNFTIRVVTDSLLKLSGTISGTAPEVIVTNPNGDELWGMAWQKTLPLQIELPPGQYNVRLFQASGTSTYSLSMAATAQTIPTINLSGNTSVSVSTNLKALRLVTAADGRVNLTLKSAAGADTYLWLLNGSWQYMFDVDDVTTSDAGLDAHLPKGVYYVYIFANKSDTTTVTGSFTSTAIPTLSASGNSGTIKGYHSFDIYKMTIGTSQLASLSIAGRGTSAPIGDSLLQVFDTSMGYVLESDDSGGGTSYHSAISATLPSGTYYACSNGYWFDTSSGAGDYTITGSTGTGTTVTAQSGLNSAAISASDTAISFKFSLLTPSRVEFNAIEKTLLDVEMFILDAKTGRAISWDDESFDGVACRVGCRLPAGDYYAVVKDWDGGTGTFDLQVIAPLNRWAGDNFMAVGQEGNTWFFLVGTKQVPAFNPIPLIVSGNVVVDLSTAVLVPVAIPKGGWIDFKWAFKPGNGIYAQAVEAEPATGRGVLTNLMK